MANEKRYYYKTTDEKGWLNLKTPDFDGVEGYLPITKKEWDAHVAELEQAREEKQNENDEPQAEEEHE